MSQTLTPLPAVEPTVVLADASPLIHFAMADLLDLPLRFGPVIVPDAVEIETTHAEDRPFASRIRGWLDDNGPGPGRNRWVERPSTDVGELLRIAIDTGRPRPRNVGEHAIINWLADHIIARGGPALVVYENGKVPAMLLREGLAEDIVVVTTRTFLHLAQQAGYLEDAEAVWAVVAARDGRANPALNYQVIQASRP